MTENWIIIKIVVAFMGGGFAGIILGAFLAGSKRAEECHNCHYVRFYCQQCAKTREVYETELKFVSDELKRQSVKMN